LELRAVVVEALKGHGRVEVAFVAAEADLALGLPGGRLDGAEFLRAAQGLDALIEDRLHVRAILRLLVRAIPRPAETHDAGHEDRHQHRTEEPFHKSPRLVRVGKTDAGKLWRPISVTHRVSPSNNQIPFMRRVNSLSSEMPMMLRQYFWYNAAFG